MVGGENLRVRFPRRCSNAVEPSMSVKKKVSVCVAIGLRLPVRSILIVRAEVTDSSNAPQE
jgi:hypothetical protein